MLQSTVHREKTVLYLKIPFDGSDLGTATQKDVRITVVRQLNINLQCCPASEVLCAILGAPSLKELKYRKRPQV